MKTDAQTWREILIKIILNQIFAVFASMSKCSGTLGQQVDFVFLKVRTQTTVKTTDQIPHRYFPTDIFSETEDTLLIFIRKNFRKK